MKNLIYLLSTTALLFSCSQENYEDDLLTEITYESSTENANTQGDAICIFTNPVTAVSPSSTITYNLTSNLPIIEWKKSNNDITFLSTTNTTAVVSFSSSFSGGTIYIEGSDNNSIDSCVASVVIESNCERAPTPHYIRSNFGSPTPDEYTEDNLGGNHLCIGTIDNTLSVPRDECVNYSWSISPGGPGIAIIEGSGSSVLALISRAGSYRVLLTTSNEFGQRTELFNIEAEDCSIGGGGGFF